MPDGSATAVRQRARDLSGTAEAAGAPLSRPLLKCRRRRRRRRRRCLQQEQQQEEEEEERLIPTRPCLRYRTYALSFHLLIF